MENLLKRIACELPVAYGRAEVGKAIEYGACEELLVSDTLLRDPDIVEMLNRAEQTNAKIVVFSSSFEPGTKLDALGGIAAILRYNIS